jgi:hypothetical protein
MTVGQLKSKLKDYHDDFELIATYSFIDETKSGYAALCSENYIVVDLGDIGYSDKVILLELKTRE